MRFDEAGRVIGITLVNATWLLEQEGRLTVTVPGRVAIAVRDISSALSAA